jgi:hypothetical protein
MGAAPLPNPALGRAVGGGSPPHERLRSRNSRHLQCCPFWCPRGTPAARYYPPPGYWGGSWWRVTGYFLAGCGLFCRVPFFFWSWWRASCEHALHRSLAFAIVLRTMLAPAPAQASTWRCSSAQQCSQLEQQATRTSSFQPCHSEWAPR